MSALTSDPKRTATRVAALQRYVEHEIMRDRFICSAFAVCIASARQDGRAFYKGQLSHVGRHYDLMADGRPLRIVIVGQEYGQALELVDLRARYRMIHDDSGLGGFTRRNPHMRGTTFALQLLLNSGLNARDETVRATGGAFHLFDAFALVNVLLCSAVVPGTMKGASTREMQRNCLHHFQATIDILEPTVTVLQGKGVRSWIAPLLTSARAISPTLESVAIGDVRTLLCSFNHPSAWGDSGWGRRDQPYLEQIVVPGLSAARRRLLRAPASE